MKARNTATFGLLVAFLVAGINTTGSAKLLQPNAQNSTSPAASAPVAPELAAADQKVSKAKEQWDTARKQLEAARALVKAAEADFKAARAAREALALQLKADGLAGASGLKQIAAQTPTVSSDASQPRLTSAPVAQPAQPVQPTAQVQQEAPANTQAADFNSEAAQGDAPQLR